MHPNSQQQLRNFRANPVCSPCSLHSDIPQWRRWCPLTIARTMGAGLLGRSSDKCNHSVFTKPRHNIKQDPRRGKSERQLSRCFAPVTNCNRRRHSHPPQTDHWFRAVHSFAVGTFSLLEPRLHCFPQQPLRRSFECDTYPTLHPATILLAWDVRIYHSHVQCLPWMCTYKPHPRSFPRAHLQLPNQSPDDGPSRQRIPSGQGIWARRFIALSRGMLRHVHICSNGTHHKC